MKTKFITITVVTICICLFVFNKTRKTEIVQKPINAKSCSNTHKNADLITSRNFFISRYQKSKDDVISNEILNKIIEDHSRADCLDKQPLEKQFKKIMFDFKTKYQNPNDIAKKSSFMMANKSLKKDLLDINKKVTKEIPTKFLIYKSNIKKNLHNTDEINKLDPMRITDYHIDLYNANIPHIDSSDFIKQKNDIVIPVTVIFDHCSAVDATFPVRIMPNKIVVTNGLKLKTSIQMVCQDKEKEISWFFTGIKE